MTPTLLRLRPSKVLSTTNTIVPSINTAMTQSAHKRSSPVGMEEGPPSKVARPLDQEEGEILLNKRPLTITLMLGECEVKRLSVDKRCHRNVIFASTLEKMCQEWDREDQPTESISL